jgi:hypothetical protein
MSAGSERTRAGRLAWTTVTAFGLVAVVVWAVRAGGFRAVSDDDFCRITIAQQFAADPRLDPTGTSWLPLPFWLLGAALTVTGRSLAAAFATAPVLATLGLVPWLWAQRRPERRPLLALALALAVDWVAWLAATPVPEVMVAALVSAPFLADDDDTRWPYALALFAATLARYEAWPLAALWAALAVRREGRRALLPASLALAGPAAWVAWNRVAHGEALHFLARVRRYAEGHGHPQEALEALAIYPRALVGDGRAILTLLALAAVALTLAPPRTMTSRAARAGLAAVALFAFLALGALRSGAHTHHPVRALVPLAFLAAPLVAEALAQRSRTLAGALTPLAVVLVAASGHWSNPPGSGTDDRTEAVRLGLAAASAGVAELHLARCHFEHFATMAAFGAPERVVVTEQEPGGPCPELRPARGPASRTP